MSLTKPISALKVAVLIPCYQRPQYTAKCLKALKNCRRPCRIDFYLADDDSNDGTHDLLHDCGLGQFMGMPYRVGLRNIIISFFGEVMPKDYDIIAKIDNDCVIPEDYFEKMLAVFEKTDVEVLSPNVYPSDAAFQYGSNDKDGLGYRPAEIVGGLWMMRAYLLDDMYFETHETNGLTGAISILKQIATEKSPRIGWAADITVQDIGHWSGRHPEHIKSVAHEQYSKEVGRAIAWKA